MAERELPDDLAVILQREAAENFCEEDEDPEEVFAWFDAGPHGMTAPPGDESNG
jgi:hypothetical protein